MGNVQPASKDSNETERLLDFKRKSHERWLELTDDLPDDNPARFPNGYFEVAFSIANLAKAPSLTELRNMLRDGPAATRGWPPFISLSSKVFQPKIINGTIEDWLGDPDGEKFFRDEYSLPFWRAHPDGYFYQIEGYLDRGPFQKATHQLVHYLENGIERLSHFLLHAEHLARRLSKDSEVFVACKYTGLKNRKLIGHPYRPVMLDLQCHDNEFDFETQLSQSQIRDNLVEVIHQQLKPLYEKFSFFELKQEDVDSVLIKQGILPS